MLAQEPALHVRGRAIMFWARHMVNYGSIAPENRESFEQRLKLYEKLGDGVPGSIISSAIIPSSPEESDKMASIIEEQKKGYARTRYGTEEDTAGASAEIDDMDIEMSLSPSLTGDKQLEHVLQALREGGTIASSFAGSEISSDYDPSWVPRVHISVFPYGDGACPAGMQLDYWSKLILERFPREAAAQHIPLLCDLLDIRLKSIWLPGLQQTCLQQ